MVTPPCAWASPACGQSLTVTFQSLLHWAPLSPQKDLLFAENRQLLEEEVDLDRLRVESPESDSGLASPAEPIFCLPD